MAWIIVVGILSLVLLAYWQIPQPGRRIDRSRIHHWTKSLLRLYADGASLGVARAGGSKLLQLVRIEGDQDSCVLALEVLRASCPADKLPALRDAHSDAGIEFSESKTGSVQFRARIPVPNIWSDDAGATAVRLAWKTLDAIGRPRDELLDISFKGRRSRERTLENLRRFRQGDAGW